MDAEVETDFLFCELFQELKLTSTDLPELQDLRLVSEEPAFGVCELGISLVIYSPDGLEK